MLSIDHKGKVYTWGNNEYGQLGNETTENSSVPICISDIDGNALKEKNIVDIYFDGYIVIAKDNEGKIYTWGGNWTGQLGNGTTEDSSVPICISDIEGNVLKGKNIVDIYSNGNTVIAKDNEGKIYIWGDNRYGQFGDGTTENSSVPICISNDGVLKNQTIEHIISGDTFIVCISQEGEAYKCVWPRPIEE